MLKLSKPIVSDVVSNCLKHETRSRIGNSRSVAPARSEL